MDPSHIRRVMSYRHQGYGLKKAIELAYRDEYSKDIVDAAKQICLSEGTNLKEAINRLLNAERSNEHETTKEPKPSPQPEAGEQVMFGTNQLFSQVENATWDLLTGKVGYRDGSSVVTINDKRITRNPIISGALPPLPAFALPTNAAQITVGDLVLNGETIIGFIIEKKEGGTFSTIDFNGRIGEWSAPEGILFGDTKVIRSLTSMLGAEQTGLQSQLMPFLLMGKDVGAMLPILLMSKIGVPGTDVKGFDPSMLMMMMALGGGNGVFQKNR